MIFMRGFFEKKPLKLPKKLSMIFYRGMRTDMFLRAASFPAIGPQLPVENIVASVASVACFRGFLFSPLSSSLHPPPAALGLQANRGAFCFFSTDRGLSFTKRGRVGSWGPMRPMRLFVEKERFTRYKIKCLKVFEGVGTFFKKFPRKKELEKLFSKSFSKKSVRDFFKKPPQKIFITQNNFKKNTIYCVLPVDKPQNIWYDNMASLKK